MLSGPGCMGWPAAPALPPPRPQGHRLLWANKPQAEAQLVTGVSRLPQPWGRNILSQGQAPAQPGWGWAGAPAGPPLQAGSQQAPVTQVLEFSARRGARRSQIPSSSHTRSSQLTAADSRRWQGKPGGEPRPRASVGGQWGPPSSWCPPSSPAPYRAPGGWEGWLWGACPTVPALITTSRWGGREGQDLTPCGGCRRGHGCGFSPKIFTAWRGVWAIGHSPKYLVAGAGAHLRGRGWSRCPGWLQGAHPALGCR